MRGPGPEGGAVATPEVRWTIAQCTAVLALGSLALVSLAGDRRGWYSPPLLGVALAPAILAVCGTCLVQVLGALAGKGRSPLPEAAVRLARPLGFGVGLVGTLVLGEEVRLIDGADPLLLGARNALVAFGILAVAGGLARRGRSLLLPLAALALVGEVVAAIEADPWHWPRIDLRSHLLNLALNVLLPSAATLAALRWHRLDARRLAQVGVTPFVASDLALLPLVVLALLSGAWLAGTGSAPPEELPARLRAFALEVPYLGPPVAVLCAGLVHRLGCLHAAARGRAGRA